MPGFGASNFDSPETGKSSYFNKHIPCVSPFRAPHLNRRGWHWLRHLCSPSLISNTGDRGVKWLLILQVWDTLLPPATPSSPEGSSQPSWCQSPACNWRTHRLSPVREAGRGWWCRRASANLEARQEEVELCYSLTLWPWESDLTIWAFVPSYLKLKFWRAFEILLPSMCCQFGSNKHL